MTVVEIGPHGVSSVGDATAGTTHISYTTTGLLNTVMSPSGITTHIDYQTVTENLVLAHHVTARDETGHELSTKTWEHVGENIFTGFPTHAGGESALWASGDSAFRYRTRITDGATAIESEYNAMGLVINRDLFMTHNTGISLAQEHTFTYPGTEQSGVPAPHEVPANHTKPIENTLTHHDGTATRTVTERMEWDTHGRMTRHTTPTGTVTTTRYDVTPASETGLPIGLPVEETVIGLDGTVSHTTNTLAPDHKSITETQTHTDTTGDLKSLTHTLTVAETDGFVSRESIEKLPGADVAEGPGSITTTPHEPSPPRSKDTARSRSQKPPRKEPARSRSMREVVSCSRTPTRQGE